MKLISLQKKNNNGKPETKNTRTELQNLDENVLLKSGSHLPLAALVLDLSSSMASAELC